MAMRYIEDVQTDRLIAVSFGAAVVCDGVASYIYGGQLPSGYDSLEEWYQVNVDQLYKWKVIDGILTLDESETAPADVVPYMEVGVEYQTIERFMGYPVYVQLVSFGDMPNATSLQAAHGISNIRDIVACGGVAVSESSSTHGIPFPLYYGYSSVGRVDLYCTAGTIFITTTADWSNRKAYVWLKYTKTTD